MSLLLVHYATAALQVTVLSVFALVLHRLLRRRHRDAAVLVLTSASVFSVVLTVATFLPMPESWSVPAPVGERAVLDTTQFGDAASRFGSDNEFASVSTDVLPLVSQISELIIRLGARLTDDSPNRAMGWHNQLATLAGISIVTVINILLIRLGVGIWSSRQTLRTGVCILDTDLNRRVAQLRGEVGCRRPVKLLVSPKIPSAATIGWRRPVLMLSSEWRAWSELELTAVLAHELTHVRRLDYPLGIVARVATSLHFFNPLVRVLATSMYFAQEAIADAAAANAVGSRQRYLVALSRLALRQDQRLTTLPFLAFGFTSSTFLMRRIKMLQTKDGQRRSSRLLRVIVVCSLVAVTVATSSLRHPAQSQESKPPGTVGVKSTSLPAAGETREARRSIDLSNIPSPKHGIMSIRPQVLLARSDMQVITRMVDAAIRRQLAEHGFNQDLEFSFADLEQAVGPIVIDPSDPERGQKGRLQIGLTAFRSHKSVPLREVLEASVPGTTTRHSELGVLIETPEAAIPAIGPQRHFAMPDDRTVLAGVSGEELTRLRQRPAADQVSGKPWFGIWQRVEQCMVAMVLDNDNVDWGQPEKADDYPHLQALLDLSRHLALAYDLERDQLQILLLIEGRSADQTGPITDHVAGAIQTLRRESEKNDNGGAEDMVLLHSVYLSVLNALAAAEPQIEGPLVSLTASVNVEPSALVAEMAGFSVRTATAMDETESSSELK